MSKHTDFILTPIESILEDVVSASNGIESGMEMYPLCDYIMQSLFLKMTGFQEQKMRCIAWEMATDDYEYRRKLLENADKLGEYSTYKAKNAIFRNLLSQIEKFNKEFSVDNKDDIDKTKILNDSIENIKKVFKESNLAKWSERKFSYFVNHSIIIQEKHFLHKGKNQVNLFENIIQEKYETLYNQRNRIAHNTLSYQQNLPSLNTLLAEDEGDRNYFVWFLLLVLIDRIFIEMYKIYIRGMEERLI